MSRQQALQTFDEALHISYSQIFTYLGCSLKYRLAYVEQRRPKRISIALPFGRAMHTAIERFYRSLMKDRKEPLAVLEELFEDSLSTRLGQTKVPIIYKKETPDTQASIDMGKALLKVFYDNNEVAPADIVDVEIPLTATLYTQEGEPTDFKLVGIVDLLMKGKDSDAVPVDHKTWAQRKAQSAIDKDLQFSSYAYLLAANKYVPLTAPVTCHINALRKLKKPKLEHFKTTRTAKDRRRFAKIASAVLAGIENQIFIPNYSWMCSDCGYTEACEAWS